MDLKKAIWTQNDKKEFQKYLLSLSKGKEKGEWEKNIVRTNLDCIAVSSKDVDNIVKGILKGNFMSFLDLNLWGNFTNTIINGKILSHIADFGVYKEYLDKFVDKADNWASIDTLDFKIKGKEDDFLDLAKKYIKSNKTFVRRCGVRILFKFISNEYIDQTLDIISTLYDEQEYYVNMAISWLICECFIKQRTKTLKFIKTQKINDFVKNKAISKCRDSYRVSKEGKELLLSLKKGG